MELEPATKPTMYFIGVTTKHSSIMKLFPLWAQELGLEDVVLKGIDVKIHDDREIYRDIASFIKSDPMSLGALVTTHKIDMFNATKDLFDIFDSHAKFLNEISYISKSNSKLHGQEKDPITSGLTMNTFLPRNYWNNDGEVIIMGAGGSALAISSYITDEKHKENIPKKIIISNRSLPRLESAKKLLSNIDTTTKFEFELCEESEENDTILEKLSPYSLVINATGLGKDRPGSPLTDKAYFPENSIIWELNYRGELDFMHQALKQEETQNLQVEDGWEYFIHGWTQVISEVFGVEVEKKIPNIKRIAEDFQSKNK